MTIHALSLTQFWNIRDSEPHTYLGNWRYPFIFPSILT